MAHEGPDGSDRGESRESTPAEEPLERMLTQLGPLLRRRLEMGAPDAAFVERLRARLLSDEAPVMAPDAATDGVGPAAQTAPRGIRNIRARRRLVAVGLAAALIVALLVVLVIREQAPRPAPVAAWHLPVPSVADLTRGFPAPPRVAAVVARDPIVSLAAPPRGYPYAGRVALSTVPLPTRAIRLLAFRLADPAAAASPQHVGLLARHLGLRAALQRLVRGQAVWVVVAAGGPPSRQPLHSVAVSQQTGELVYHDPFSPAALRREVWQDNPFAVAAARHWLLRLGWPGTRMPLITIEHSGLPTGMRQIELGWAGTGPVATDAASLWVTPAGHVVEADVWPPAESVRAIVARSVTAAWAAVHDRLVPLAVEGVLAHITAPGVGLMRHVAVAQVLSMGPDQRLYLVPTYRFAGSVRLRGIHGARPCYALAPASQT